MPTTQDHIRIQDIHDDLVFLKDGSVTAIVQTSAVNFALLAEMEQVAIIDSFAGLLNSLSFAIQINIRSQRLDVSSYLTILDEARKKQTNPLLMKIIERYRNFVESMIKDNEVLDKQFYVALNVSSLEMGIIGGDKTLKAQTVLKPRIDHIIRQLGRIGLKSKQLDTESLIKLFYTAYNNPDIENQMPAPDITVSQ
jgi:hypothetical protein